MGYTSLQIGEILLKADRTMYKIGSIAYNNMFAENDETLDYQRDIIYIYKKAVEWGDDYYVGTAKLDKIVERLAAYIAIYDYGTLSPVYSSSVSVITTWIPPGAALNDLTDVTLTNILDKQYLRYDASSQQWVNFGAGTTIRSSQAFTATAGQTTFTTTAPFEANLIDVYLNGVKLNTASYTVFGQHSIILNDAAEAGDIMDVIIYDPVSTIVNPPSQAGNAGKFLTTDGFSLSWAVNPLGSVTSVDMSVPTGFAITGNPVTTAGTLALGFEVGYSLPSNALQGNWDTAYNRSLTSASVSGTTNKTLTLNKQDGGTITATWSDYDTQGVTSVSTNIGTTGTDINSNVVNPTTTPTININVPDASAASRGALTSTDWTTFNSKQAAITLTTTGSSGAATFIANVLNIPNYGAALSGYVPTSRQLTINGTAYDLSADRSWSVGTVTSVNMSVPTGFAIANNPITTSGTLALSYAAGYALPTTASQGNWDTAYTFVSNFPSQTGNAGKYLTTDGSVLSWAVLNLANYVPTSRTLTINGVTYDLSADRTWTIVAGVSSVAGTAPISAVNVSGAVTISISQSSASTDGYLSSTDWTTFNSKQPAGNYITSLTGEATASGPGAASVTLTNSAVIGKVLTGLNVTGGSISATDSILAAFGKIQNQINGLIGGLQYQGTWNASTNTPTLTSGVGTNGYFYIVSVAGSTNLDGITDWKVGDWAVYHAASWQKVDNTESVTSVNGFTGAVSLTTSNISEGTNLYFTDLRARQAISLTTTGTSGAATYDNTTGVLNIPQYQGGVTSFNTRTGAITLLDTDVTGALGYTPVTNARTLTINGTTFDLTANRTWSVGTVTSVGLSMPSAFTVTNSPVTGSGTLTVTAAGLASQYVRGDGTLGDFPAGGGGGGASVSYYLNGSVNQGTFGGNTYYEMSKTPVIGLGTDFNISSNGYVASFITDANDPALLLIPGGNFNLEFYFSASSSGGTPSYYVELYKYDGTTFTLIASNSANPDIITSGTSTEAYFTSLSVPETVITATDRLAIRIHVTPSGRTITLHTEDNNLCQVITTFTTGLTALNGLTKQVQYFAVGTSGTDFAISSSVDTHTFNLPTASATNRGALSSADWTTFNNKVPATRTLTINSVSFDLSADRSWTIGPTIYSRGLQKFTATAGQTTFTITNGYTVGLVDVYRNGVKLDNALEFTASNGTTVVLTDAAALNDVIEVYKYGSEYIPNNALRTVNTFTATAAQTTFSATYSVGLLDVFYNGAKLAAAEYTATNGTTVVLASACAVGDIVEIIAYSYLVNGYSGISGTGNSGYIPKFTSATSIGNSLIQDNGTTITLGGALSGTSATFSGNMAIGGVSLASWYTGYSAMQIGASASIFGNKTTSDTNTTQIANNAYLNTAATAWVYINSDEATRYEQVNGEHKFYTAASGTAGNNITWTTPLSIASTGAATFSGNIIFDTTDRGLVSNTSDGSDNKFVTINGGGARGSDRGGGIVVFGNESAGTGRIDINAGDVTGGVINLVTAGFNRLIINRDGAATFSSTVKVGSTSGGDSLVSTANAGTNPASFSFVNSGGTSYIGAENSGGGSLVTGSNGYDLICRGPSGITFSANNGVSPNMRITNGGNVGIGLTDVKEKFEVAANWGNLRLYGRGGIRLNNLSNNLYYNGSAWVRDNASYGAQSITFDTNGAIIFENSSATSGDTSPRMTITSGGSVAVTTGGNKTEGTAQFYIDGSGYTAYHWLDATAYYIGQNSSLRELRMYSGATTAGVKLTNGSTSWGTYSDERLKTNIEDIGSVLDKVKDLRTVKYHLKDVDANDRQKRYGLIAQDLVGKFDEVLGLSKYSDELPEEYYDLRYTELVPILVKAIQELKAELDRLKNK
jgi:hypothetical protein